MSIFQDVDPNQFDQETQELFKIRPTPENIQVALYLDYHWRRDDWNFLRPVLHVSKEKAQELSMNSTQEFYKYLLGLGWSIFASH